MDPTACYLAMFEAMNQGDLESARDHALSLRDWLESGGFYPPNYSQVEVESYLASVLNRTAGCV